MWTTLAAVMALAPAQAGKLELTNARYTYGMVGATRSDTKYLPGDSVYLAYDINNLKFDANGRANYTIAMDILDADGKVLFAQNPQAQVAQNYLGGTSLPGVAHRPISPKAKPGKYKIRLTVEDRTTMQKASLEREAEVLPPGFGLVEVYLSTDPEGKVPSPPGGVVGQRLFVNFTVVGFGRDAKEKHPKVQVKLNILDDKGKPTFAGGLLGRAEKEVPEELTAIPMQFGLVLNRRGDYVLELSADCKLGSAGARGQLPMRCVHLM
jgi:hypothetical protein